MTTPLRLRQLLAAVDLTGPHGVGEALRLVEELCAAVDAGDLGEAPGPDARDGALRTLCALLEHPLPAYERALVTEFCVDELLRRHDERHAPEDLVTALHLRRRAAGSAGPEEACAAWFNLASLAMEAWDRTGREQHLAEAGTALAAAAGHAATGVERALVAGARGNLCSLLHQVRPDPARLREAIDAFTVTAACEDPAVAAKGQASLAAAHLDLHRASGDGGDHELVEAERLARQALDDPTTPPTTWRRELLVRVLRERCARDGDRARLDEAWQRISALLEEAGEDPQARAALVGTAASVAHLRYLTHHDRAVLAETIGLAEEALGVEDGAHRPDPQARAVLANEVCLLLTERFTLDGDRQDLDRAVDTARRSLDDRLPPGIGLGLRTNLAGALYRRYESYGEIGDLERGIALMRGVTSRASGAPDRADALTTLALFLDEKGRLTGDDDDFREALAHIDEAIALTPGPSSDRAGSLIDKATVIEDRAESRAARTGRAEPPLDDMIALLDEARRQAPEGSAVRARAAHLLGSRLARRAGLHELAAVPDATLSPSTLGAAEAADLRVAFERWNETLSLDEPFVTVETGQELGNAAFSLGEWGTAALGFRAALGAADELTDRRTLDADRRLARFPVQGVAAACALSELRAGSAREAVLRLEEGAATLSARSLGGRARPTGYDDVVAAAELLGGPLVYWAATLAGGFAVVVRPDGSTDAHELPEATSVRAESRLDALRTAFTRYRGPDERVLADWDSAVRDVLAWTWDAMVAPVADALGDAPTVGLVPVGRLASLPLAAAGAAPAGSLLSRTLPRLLPAARAVRPPTPWPEAPGVVVGVDPGEGGRRLPYAAAEAGLVADCYTRVRHVSVPRPEEPAARREGRRVLRARGTASGARPPGSAAEDWAEAFGGAEIAHVICHYDLDPERPFDSVLRFGDGVRVADLLRQRLPGAPHLVLSACDTGLGGIRLPDEALGLGTALLAAGARSAVAALWPLDDELAAGFMAAYHRRLATGTDPAEALAATQREAAAEGPAVVWPGLVHLG